MPFWNLLSPPKSLKNINPLQELIVSTNAILELIAIAFSILKLTFTTNAL
jgi:hypothetical protein